MARRDDQIIGTQVELLYEQGFTISGARNKLDTRLDDGAAGVLPSVNGKSTGIAPKALAIAGMLRKELTDIAKLLRF